jgi:hypothetical protein
MLTEVETSLTIRAVNAGEGAAGLSNPRKPALSEVESIRG